MRQQSRLKMQYSRAWICCIPWASAALDMPSPTPQQTPKWPWLLQGFVATPQTPKWHLLVVDVFRTGWQCWCELWCEDYTAGSCSWSPEDEASSARWQTGTATPAWALPFPSGEWKALCDPGPCAQQPQLFQEHPTPWCDEHIHQGNQCCGFFPSERNVSHVQHNQSLKMGQSKSRTLVLCFVQTWKYSHL